MLVHAWVPRWRKQIGPSCILNMASPLALLTTQNLGSGPYTGTTTASYQTVTLNNLGSVLTQRVHQDDPRQLIPNNQWAFADCFHHALSRHSEHHADLPQRRLRYEPHLRADLYGKEPNGSRPRLRSDARSRVVPAQRYERRKPPRRDHSKRHHVRRSQTGRTVRTFLDLGFNEDKVHKIV